MRGKSPYNLEINEVILTNASANCPENFLLGHTEGNLRVWSSPKGWRYGQWQRVCSSVSVGTSGALQTASSDTMISLFLEKKNTLKMRAS